MTSIYILVNIQGILLGVYRNKIDAINKSINYFDDGDISTPDLYLYRCVSKDVNKNPSNKFELVWTSLNKLSI
jgi:hypothetical protein